ncbi:MAG: hypothetical protein ACLVBY_00440 [Oscillospiraceae bacterium]
MNRQAFVFKVNTARQLAVGQQLDLVLVLRFFNRFVQRGICIVPDFCNRIRRQRHRQHAHKHDQRQQTRENSSFHRLISPLESDYRDSPALCLLQAEEKRPAAFPDKTLRAENGA